MASSGTIWGKQVGRRPRLSIYWKAVRQDIPNNRTEIEATLRLHSTYPLYFSANKTGSLDGTSFTYKSGFSGTGKVNLSTKKFWVNHSSDGTKSKSISGSFNIAVTYSGTYLRSLSVSGSMSLNRIPRGSELNSASITALKNGTSSTLTIGRKVHSSAFYHLVSIYDGNTWIWDTGYIKGKPSTTHTIPSGTVNTMLKRMSTVTSKSYTVRLRTYTKSGGSGQIGSVSRSMKISVHSDVKPSVNKPSVSIDGNRRDKAISKYVQSFSKVKASVSGSAGYGSSVKTYNMKVRRVGGSDSQSISGSSGTTSRAVALAGSYEVIGTVTDARGRSNTNKATFTVEAYSPPAITSFTAERDESAQTTVNITRATTHSPLGGGGNNNLSYTVQRKIGTGAWTNVNTRGSGTITASPSSDTSTSTGNAVTNSYQFRYVVTDQFGGRAESVVSVTTQRVVLDIHKNEGVGIGKIHEDGALDVGGDIRLAPLKGLGSTSIGPESQINFTRNEELVRLFHRGADENFGIYIGTQSNARTRLRWNKSFWNFENIKDTDVRINGNPIMESGSNENGNWVQFYDGTQICWRRWSIAKTTSGTGYPKIDKVEKLSFPKQFSNVPAVTLAGEPAYWRGTTPDVTKDYGGMNLTADHSTNRSVTRSSFRYQAYFKTYRGNVAGNYIAIGRWK